jgi:DNA ligase-1
MQRRHIFALVAWAALVPNGGKGALAAAGDAPPLMLANVYRPGVTRLADYWVSEKYDGVRGYWDGALLRTRGGERIAVPEWFTAGWPNVPLDGELWAGRGRFSHAVSTVRQQTPLDAAWRDMRFMVFDLPAHGGTFTERITAYQQLLAQLDVPWVQPVAQRKVASDAALQALMRQAVKAGGEGVMLHRGDSLYRATRNDDLLKYKPYDDAEARVIAHLPGQGKHTGQLGALLVQTEGGLRLKLGTGFTDAQRAAPPAVGTWVTYRYRGTTDKGTPRFASFLRVREDWTPAPKADAR